jgi:hypothetical protein
MKAGGIHHFCRRSREGGNPWWGKIRGDLPLTVLVQAWIPAFAGMTG